MQQRCVAAIFASAILMSLLPTSVVRAQGRRVPSSVTATSATSTPPFPAIFSNSSSTRATTSTVPRVRSSSGLPASRTDADRHSGTVGRLPGSPYRSREDLRRADFRIRESAVPFPGSGAESKYRWPLRSQRRLQTRADFNEDLVASFQFRAYAPLAMPTEASEMVMRASSRPF